MSNFNIAAPKDPTSEYYRIKNSHLELKKKTDSVFLILYQLSDSDPKLSIKLSKDFISFSQSKNKVYAKAFLALGYSYQARGSLKESRHFLELSYDEFAKEKDTISMCFSLQALSNVYFRIENYDLAISKNKSALNLAQKINNDFLIANSLSHFGLIMSSKGNYQLAKDYYHKVLLIRLKYNSLFMVQVCYTNLGIACKNLNQLDSAFYYQRKSLSIAKQLKSEGGIAYTYNDLGALHLKLNNLDSAEWYLKNSIILRLKIGEEWELGYTYNYLGQLYRKLNLLTQSIDEINKAIKLGLENGNTKQLYESYEELSLTYSKRQQLDSTIFYYKKFIQLKDSIDSSRKSLAAEMMISSYESEVKQQRIELLKNKNELQKLYINQQNNWLWGVSLVLLIIICFVFIFVRNRQLQLLRIKMEQKKKEDKIRAEGEEKISNYRNQVSMELHDSVGANLTFVKELVKNLHSSEETRELEEVTEETIQELRKSVWLLNKQEVSFEDWIIRLKEYYKHLKMVTVVSGDETSNPTLPSTIVTELFRVTQEAVNNALKYSGSKIVEIKCTIDEKLLYLQIKDNGNGMLNTSTEGFGIKNMKQRILSIEGTISITSIEKGTIVEISVPI